MIANSDKVINYEYLNLPRLFALCPAHINHGFTDRLFQP